MSDELDATRESLTASAVSLAVGEGNFDGFRVLADYYEERGRYCTAMAGRWVAREKRVPRDVPALPALRARYWQWEPSYVRRSDGPQVLPLYVWACLDSGTGVEVLRYSSPEEAYESLVAVLRGMLLELKVKEIEV